MTDTSIDTSKITKEQLLQWFKTLCEEDISIPLTDKAEKVIERANSNR